MIRLVLNDINNETSIGSTYAVAIPRRIIRYGVVRCEIEHSRC